MIYSLLQSSPVTELTGIPPVWEKGAFYTILFLFTVGLIWLANTFSRRDKDHNETLKQLSSDNKAALQLVVTEHRAALGQTSADSRASIEKMSSSLDGFGRVMAKRNSIDLARLPIDIQNEINRMHPEDKP